jgi:hypothetical protein
VLPTQLRDRLVADLDKRLDLDIDELLDSPKLRLQLSPAELDKSLLELYDTVSKSPGGDLLRVICGGGPIGLQNLYIRRQTQKNLYQQGVFAEFFPSPLDDDSEREDPAKRTAAQRIRWALRKNVPRKSGMSANATATISSASATASTTTSSPPSLPSIRGGQDTSISMCALTTHSFYDRRVVRYPASTALSPWNGFRPRSTPALLKGTRRKSLSLSLLI